METLANRAVADISTLRLKELDRLCYAYDKLNFRPTSMVDKQLLEAIAAELPKRNAERKAFPEDFASCTRYLACRQFPCGELIATVLEPEFLATTYGSAENFDETVLFLDSFTRINLRNDYDGPQLSDRQRHAAASSLCTHEVNTIEEEVFETVTGLYRHPIKLRALPHFAEPGTVKRRASSISIVRVYKFHLQTFSSSSIESG